MKIPFHLWPYLSVAWISACASPVELPKTADTVRSLYRQAVLSDAPTPMPRLLPVEAIEGNPFLEAVDGQLRRDFQSPPNPRLILYVYPHFAADGAPIPGYATWFNVFEREPVLRVVR